MARYVPNVVVSTTLRPDAAGRPSQTSSSPPLTECQDQSPKHENAIFDALCTATSLNQTWGRCMIHLDHHLYNHLNDPCVWQTS